MDIFKAFRKKEIETKEVPRTRRVVKGYDLVGLLGDHYSLQTAQKIIENSIYVDRCIKENGKRISSLDCNEELRMNHIYTDQEMIFAIYASMELEGYAVLWNDGRDVKILDVRCITKNLEKGYITYVKEDKSIEIPMKEIAILHNFTPYLNIYGRSALTAAVKRLVNSHRNQEEAVNSFYKNGMFSNAFIWTDKELTRKNYEELTAQIVDQFSGPENAGSIPILHSGARVESLSLSPDQFRQLASDNVTMESIAVAFEVPPLVLGRMEGGWDKKDTIMEFYINGTIIPKAKNIASQIDRFLLPLMRNRVKEFFFIYDNIPEVQRAKEYQAAGLIPFVQAGIFTINDVREKLGYKPVEWGYKPMNMMNEMDTMGAGGTGTNEMEEVEKKEEISSGGKGEKSFLSKVKSIEFKEPEIWHKSVREDNHKRIEQFESILRPKFKTVLKQMKKDLMEQVNEMKSPEEVELIEIPSKYIKKFKSLGRTYYPNLYYMAGQSVMLAYKNRRRKIFLPSGEKIGISFNLDDPFLQLEIENSVDSMANYLFEGSKNLFSSLLHGIVKEARKEGLGVTDTMKMIQEKTEIDLTGWLTLRNEKIARTEGMKINTRGSIEGARQNKMNAKAWLHSGAVNFRPTHKAMNPNHYIPLESYFNVGGVKMYGPGDGPPDEVTWCGCSLLFDWRE